MNRLLRFIFLSFLILGFTACQKSKQEETKSSADSLITQQNQLARELNSMGTPVVSWSDEKLDLYQTRLSKLESVENALARIDGKNGVYILGDNERKMGKLKTHLADVRSSKRKKQLANTPEALEEQSKKKAHEDLKKEERDQLKEEIAQSMREQKERSKEYNQMSIDELSSEITFNDQINRKIENYISLLESYRYNLTNSTLKTLVDLDILTQLGNQSNLALSNFKLVNFANKIKKAEDERVKREAALQDDERRFGPQ